MLASLWLLSLPALADDVLLHADLGVELARARLQEDAGVSAGTTATLPELLGGRSPFLVGGGRLEACDSAPTDSDALKAAVDAAKGSLNYGDVAAAETGLLAALDTLGCLVDPIDVVSAAQLYFLLGLTAYDSDGEARAMRYFAQAHVYTPGMPWDDTYATDAQPLFDEAALAATRRRPTRIRLVPAPDPAVTVWLDGEQLPDARGFVEVAPGEHLLQFGSATFTTLRFTVDFKKNELLFTPARVGERDLAWVADPERQKDLDAVLSPFLPDDATLWATLPQGTWSRAPGETWTQVASHRLRRRRRNVVNTVLMSLGAGLLVGGGTTATVGYLQGLAAIRDGDAANNDDWDTYLDAEQRYDTATDLLLVGEVLAGVGLGTGLVGLTIPFGRTAYGKRQAQLERSR